MCKQKLNTYITISKCARVRKNVLDKMNNCYKSKYGLLYSYAKELELSNSGTTTDVRVDDSNPYKISYFSKFYVFFATCR